MYAINPRTTKNRNRNTNIYLLFNIVFNIRQVNLYDMYRDAKGSQNLVADCKANTTFIDNSISSANKNSFFIIRYCLQHLKSKKKGGLSLEYSCYNVHY